MIVQQLVIYVMFWFLNYIQKFLLGYFVSYVVSSVGREVDAVFFYGDPLLRKKSGV